MAKLPQAPIGDLWSALKWQSGDLVRVANKNQPLTVKESPKAPGLYRITWVGVEGWANVLKFIEVKSTLKVADRLLEFENLKPPVLLTIGKTPISTSGSASTSERTSTTTA